MERVQPWCLVTCRKLDYPLFWNFHSKINHWTKLFLIDLLVSSILKRSFPKDNEICSTFLLSDACDVHLYLSICIWQFFEKCKVSSWLNVCLYDSCVLWWKSFIENKHLFCMSSVLYLHPCIFVMLDLIIRRIGFWCTVLFHMCG